MYSLSAKSLSGEYMDSGKLRLRKTAEYIVNLDILNRSGLSFETNSNTPVFKFRESGKPAVDFYPSTGKWRKPGTVTTYKGGALRFLEWYGRQ